MFMVTKYEIIPRNDTPVSIPSDICIQYVGGMDEINENTVQGIIEKIRQGTYADVYLSLDPDGDDRYMQMESTDGWIFLQYCEEVNRTWYSSYNVEYADSDEEAPIICSDGQSVVEKKYTMHNLDLAVKCIEYFIRTGQLYPGMEWIKGWRE